MLRHIMRHRLEQRTLNLMTAAPPLNHGLSTHRARCLAAILSRRHHSSSNHYSFSSYASNKSSDDQNPGLIRKPSHILSPSCYSCASHFSKRISSSAHIHKNKLVSHQHLALYPRAFLHQDIHHMSSSSSSMSSSQNDQYYSEYQVPPSPRHAMVTIDVCLMAACVCFSGI